MLNEARETVPLNAFVSCSLLTKLRHKIIEIVACGDVVILNADLGKTNVPDGGIEINGCDGIFLKNNIFPENFLIKQVKRDA